ncbi:transmembrane 9 superfamily member 5 [Tanacetum coccineum]
MEDESWTGDGKGSKYYRFKHVHFDALYNGDQVIEIRAFCDPNHVVDITDVTEINVEFTYSIKWNATSREYKNRMNKYSRASLLPTQRYSSGDEEQNKEMGWKYDHSDVFRYPPQMALFCAVLGTGTQLLIM